MTDDMNARAMRIAGRRDLTAYVTEFTLTPTDDAPLEPYGPGAHVTIETPWWATARHRKPT